MIQKIYSLRNNFFVQAALAVLLLTSVVSGGVYFDFPYLGSASAFDGGDGVGNDSSDSGASDSSGGDGLGGDGVGNDNPSDPSPPDQGGGHEQPATLPPPPVVDIVGSYPVGSAWQQGPITIKKGDSVALGWVSSFADQCTVVSSPNLGSWSGTNQGPNPPLFTPQSQATFTITCTNAAGSATDTLVINPLSPPVVDIVGSYPIGTAWQQGPITIKKGDSVALGWVSSFADQCTVISSPNLGSWNGTTGPAQAPYVTPLVDTTFTITCTNSVGSATDTLVIKPVVQCIAPKITLGEGTSASGIVGQPFKYNFSVTGSVGFVTNAINLPPGLSLYAASIQGTPTTPGTYTVTIKSEGECGSDTKTITITIKAACIPPTLPTLANADASLNQFFSYVIPGAEGTSPVSTSVTGLPSGLTYQNGKISGTPTQAGTFTVSVKATNDCGTVIKQFTITVKVPVCVPGVPSITSALSAEGVKGQFFSYVIQATNEPTNFSASGLPQGLTLSGNKISGTPLQVGTFNVTIKAANQCGSDYEVLVIKIKDIPPPPQCVPGIPVITSSTSFTGKVGVPFLNQIAVQNSPTSLTVNGLPPGLSFSQSTNKITGIPTQAGTYSVVIRAENDCGVDQKTITITIAPKKIPVCTFTSNKAEITLGGSATLSWSSSDATSAIFNPSLGVNTLSGSKTVSPTDTTTYTGVFTGPDGSVECNVTITVNKPGAPTCTLSTSDYSIVKGESATLSWSSSNAASVVFTPSIGTSALSGTKTVSPQVTTTYKGVFTGPGGSVTCEKRITVVEPEAPSCTITASKTSIKKGETTVLSWNSANATSASLNQEIGGVYLDGSRTVSPIGDATFTLTVEGDGGSATCDVYIAVTEEPSIPQCPFYEDDKNIIIKFNGDYVVANGSESAARTDAVSTSVPEGTYRVKLASYDNHSGKPNQNQPKEQWYLRLTKSDFTILAQSLSIRDLPADEDFIYEEVQDNFVVPTGVTKAKGVHTFYPDSNPNSITPICAELRPIEPEICVPGEPSITSVLHKSGVVGGSFSYTITADKDVDVVSASPLPPGITRNGNTLSGTFTQAGTFNVTLSVSNDCGSDTKILVITVTAPSCDVPAPEIENEDFSVVGTVGTSFLYEIETSGVVTSISAEDLPEGLSLVGNEIKGIPTETGTFNVTLRAANDCGSDVETLEIKINGAPVCTPGIPVINSATSTAGTVGVPYVYTITALNSPNSFSVATSTLPPGLGWSGAIISGIPTSTGTFTVNLQSENHCGTGTEVLTIVINSSGGQCPLTIPEVTSSASASGTVGTAFSYQIAASGTVASYSATSLPAGLSISTTTGLISGTPTETGNASVTISAVNQCGSGSKIVVININGGGGGCTSNCGGGGGGFPPNVTLTRATTSTPLASAIISLSQVPYTGFGDVLGTIGFILAVLIVSIALAYMSVYRESPVKALSLVMPIVSRTRETFATMFSARAEAVETIWEAPIQNPHIVVGPIEEVKEAWNSYEDGKPALEVSYPVISNSLPKDNREENGDITSEIARGLSSIQSNSRKEATDSREIVNTAPVLDREIEEMAREGGVLLSEGVASLVITAADSDISKARLVINQLVDVAKEWYPTSEDNFLVLSLDKARKILFSTYISMIPLFVKWIADGESKKVFGLLRILNQQGHSISDFVGKIVSELDTAYRYKSEGVGNPDRFTLDVVSNWKRATFEAVIGSLVSGVDESYGSEYLAAKLAFTKALDVAKVEREERV